MRRESTAASGGWRRVALRAALFAVAVGTAAASHAQSTVGHVAARSGEVEVRHGEAVPWTPLSPGATVSVRDEIQTHAGAALRLLLADGSVIVMGPRTTLRLQETAAEPARMRVRLTVGRLRAAADSSGRFEVETQSAVASGRGAEFIVLHDNAAARTEVIALAGTVGVQGLLGLFAAPVTLSVGTGTTVRRGALPTASAPVADARLAALRAELDCAVSPADSLLTGFTGADTRAVHEAPGPAADQPASRPTPKALQPPPPARWRQVAPGAEITDESVRP